MSLRRFCDGCDKFLPNDRFDQGRVVTGTRTEHSGQGASPLPNGTFDWCQGCAKVAFAAVKRVNSGDLNNLSLHRQTSR